MGWKLVPVRIGAALAGVTLLASAGIGASAATGGSLPLPQSVNDVLSTVGLTDNHGKNVRQSVQGVLDSSSSGGARGQDVSDAACGAAHNPSTLPQGAQNAPGQNNSDATDCNKNDDASNTDATPTTKDKNDERSGQPATNDNQDDKGGAADKKDDSQDKDTSDDGAKGSHGSAVSDAVHGAIASTTPGPDRGKAVSEAACTAAHARSTLPQGAQNAPGQEDREGKDCGQPPANPTPGVTPSAPPMPSHQDQDPGSGHGQGQGDGSHGDGQGQGQGEGHGQGRK